ncbi:hypothetical protein FIBSPDRAFT_848339 [Athelia psychrophila]|uniref:Uncharacterized protein n=1 Tax=Athelia psychrophila TaxID=1759441 RepID=A0A166VAK9_9AGAM|nr:hypothetical protein FIBSPDRAFT_848339 [Fibularhizoctonia sp. CBS 109695]
MVTLVGGYVLSYKDTAKFADANNLHYQDEVLAGISINRFFREEKLDNPMPALIAVPWRVKGVIRSRIMLPTRMTDDNIKFKFEEGEKDLNLRRRLLEYKGLDNVPLPFVTVANPFGKGR